MENPSFPYVLSNYTLFIVLGTAILLLGIAIPRFRWYFLIAGLNTRSKEDLSKMNLRFIEKYFGWFTKTMGLLIILNPFVCVYLGYESLINICFVIIVVAIAALTILYGAVNKQKIYHS
jgi:UDP-N-acetylmuramyl pentapeptide phosphotransferase/UDP-N-acetylglucosamine-1-phosphate transferase